MSEYPTDQSSNKSVSSAGIMEKARASTPATASRTPKAKSPAQSYVLILVLFVELMETSLTPSSIVQRITKPARFLLLLVK